MSGRQEKRKRKEQRAKSAVIEAKKNKAEEKPKRDLKTAMKEIWASEDNRFLLICALGLIVIFLSTALPGRIGLMVQTLIVVLIVLICLFRRFMARKETEETKENTENEENT